MSRITEKAIRSMIDRINETLEEREYTWRFVESHAYGIMDVKQSYLGNSRGWNITPDACTTKRELYNWLRGFASGLWTRKE